MCSPVGGKRDGRGPVFGAVLEVLDGYHACCSQRLSDSINVDSCAVMTLNSAVQWMSTALLEVTIRVRDKFQVRRIDE